MFFLRVIVPCFLLHMVILGVTAIVCYVAGRRAGFFRGVCRGMHHSGRLLGQGIPLPDFDQEYREAFRRPN